MKLFLALERRIRFITIVLFADSFLWSYSNVQNVCIFEFHSINMETSHGHFITNIFYSHLMSLVNVWLLWQFNLCGNWPFIAVKWKHQHSWNFTISFAYSRGGPRISVRIPIAFFFSSPFKLIEHLNSIWIHWCRRLQNRTFTDQWSHSFVSMYSHVI